ncbi:metallophosphoesterase family protein [Streptomyces sp. NPDC088733]|uniref:metallophosphoesterase family protein n=1 Tax=Streptomyces sp. NPDC088733 TaxID=3365880 RepID=UPI0037F8BE20
MSDGPQLLAVSDLHVGYRENRSMVEGFRPGTDGDWLIVAGDVGEYAADVEWALSTLAENFSRVIWLPGNHELWTPKDDPVQLRGVARYEYLVAMCRRLGVLTPEDPYPVWQAPDGPVTVAPLFLLYDYTFTPPGLTGKEQALEQAYAAGVVCSDEFLLHPDPLPSREAWSQARVTATEARLAALPPGTRTVLANHFPLTRDPTLVLRYPEFALWCGTERTARWHVRFGAVEVVYGHLHIPRTLWIDGVRFTEVSVGYPREWQRHGGPPPVPRRVLSGTGQGAAR